MNSRYDQSTAGTWLLDDARIEARTECLAEIYAAKHQLRACNPYIARINAEADRLQVISDSIWSARR